MAGGNRDAGGGVIADFIRLDEQVAIGEAGVTGQNHFLGGFIIGYDPTRQVGASHRFFLRPTGQGRDNQEEQRQAAHHNARSKVGGWGPSKPPSS